MIGIQNPVDFDFDNGNGYVSSIQECLNRLANFMS